VDVETVGLIQALEQDPTPVRPPVSVGVAEEKQDAAASRLADQEVAGLRESQKAGSGDPLGEQPDRGSLGAADAAAEGALGRGLYAPPQERLPEGDVDRVALGNDAEADQGRAASDHDQRQHEDGDHEATQGFLRGSAEHSPGSPREPKQGPEGG
jgi:hypothetical protein